eukprot:Protomagalhaensia_wolfi_Nauph_80__4476@NODE_458_length_2484_cov_146_091207_g344_i0_p4_GENE_NODE_458_length_2484_cov_146_091207_g344_i0NODE_458_length_2484_cov_146_091207_g344_i0_p4_ORF_typecomplete_len107_score4_89AOX/PF01786_17/0_01_NODE_458_length_2484_cov_146_091207_g344_i0261581
MHTHARTSHSRRVSALVVTTAHVVTRMRSWTMKMTHILMMARVSSSHAGVSTSHAGMSTSHAWGPTHSIFWKTVMTTSWTSVMHLLVLSKLKEFVLVTKREGRRKV